MNNRPDKDDYGPFYQNYIDQVPEGDILQLLDENSLRFVTKLKDLSKTEWDHSYQSGKWTVKEIIMHIIDTERIMSYRALRVARGDSTPLPGFEQDDYVQNMEISLRSSSSIIKEFKSVRASTETLFHNLERGAWNQRGVASGYPITVNALAYIIIGHIYHHLNVLKEKYSI
jgi:hypothetical protein